jgi:homeodomain-containing protein
MPKQHVVRLTPAQRHECGAILRRGRSSALEQRRARVLLAADAGPDGPRHTDGEVAAMVAVTPRTVARVRTAFCQRGFAVALRGHPRPRPVPPKLDALQEARIIAVACMEPPAGRATWTLQLLADQVVLLEGMPPVSRELVRRTLKKTPSGPGWSSGG